MCYHTLRNHQETFTTHNIPDAQENCNLKLLLLLKVFHFLLGVGHDSVGARFPAGGADLAVLVSVLESLNQAQCLVH